MFLYRQSNQFEYNQVFEAGDGRSPIVKQRGYLVDIPGEHKNQGNDVGGSNERCLLTSRFDAKKSWNESKQRAFDCHILAPFKQ